MKYEEVPAKFRERWWTPEKHEKHLAADAAYAKTKDTEAYLDVLVELGVLIHTTKDGEPSYRKTNIGDQFMDWLVKWGNANDNPEKN